MKRTTIRIEPKLLEKAKKEASVKDVTLQQIINESLEIYIDLIDKNKLIKKSKIKSHPGFKTSNKDIDKLIEDKEFVRGFE